MKLSCAWTLAALLLAALAGGASASRQLLQELPPGATNASLATAATTTAAALITAAGIPVHNTTIFTPTNDAFTSLGLDIPAADFFNATLNSTSFNVLLTHVVPGIYNSSTIPPGNTTVTSLSGVPLLITNGPAGITISLPQYNSSASVLQPDIPFGDNIVHVIDNVLLPIAPGAAAAAATPPSPAGP